MKIDFKLGSQELELLFTEGVNGEGTLALKSHTHTRSGKVVDSKHYLFWLAEPSRKRVVLELRKMAHQIEGVIIQLESQ